MPPRRRLTASEERRSGAMLGCNCDACERVRDRFAEEHPARNTPPANRARRRAAIAQERNANARPVARTVIATPPARAITPTAIPPVQLPRNFAAPFVPTTRIVAQTNPIAPAPIPVQPRPATVVVDTIAAPVAAPFAGVVAIPAVTPPQAIAPVEAALITPVVQPPAEPAPRPIRRGNVFSINGQCNCADCTPWLVEGMLNGVAYSTTNGGLTFTDNRGNIFIRNAVAIAQEIAQPAPVAERLNDAALLAQANELARQIDREMIANGTLPQTDQTAIGNRDILTTARARLREAFDRNRDELFTIAADAPRGLTEYDEEPQYVTEEPRYLNADEAAPQYINAPLRREVPLREYATIQGQEDARVGEILNDLAIGGATGQIRATPAPVARNTITADLASRIQRAYTSACTCAECQGLRQRYDRQGQLIPGTEQNAGAPLRTVTREAVRTWRRAAAVGADGTTPVTRACGNCTVTDTYCVQCGECFNCCSCNEADAPMPPPVLRRPNAPGGAMTAQHPKDRKMFDCPRLVGVEWEYNAARQQQPLLDWREKWNGGDHSDGSCGREIVTAPIAGDKMVQCLTDLGAAFAKSGAVIDERCGIHVHVDAKDLAWPDMFRLLNLYAFVEPLMYLLAGQERIKNQYCRPCGDAYQKALVKEDQKSSVMSVAYGTTADGRQYKREYHPDKKQQGRYRGLNLSPWLAGRTAGSQWNAKRNRNIRGIAADTTVEFRIHRNTSDAERVIGWTKLCARLVDWAAKSSDAELKQLPKSALRALCTVVAPDCAPWILNRIKVWRKENRKLNRGRLITLKQGQYKIAPAA